jgi:hypothetical protein
MCGSRSAPAAPAAPTQTEIIAQQVAAKETAKAETEKIRAEQEVEKEKENTKIVAQRTKTAENDLARRTRNRTLLGGIGLEEEDDENALEAGKKSTAKAKRATLIGSMGGGI